jgi:hypothetical protein
MMGSFGKRPKLGNSDFCFQLSQFLLSTQTAAGRSRVSPPIADQGGRIQRPGARPQHGPPQPKELNHGFTPIDTDQERLSIRVHLSIRGKVFAKRSGFGGLQRKEHRDKRLCCLFLRSLRSFAAIHLWLRMAALHVQQSFSVSVFSVCSCSDSLVAALPRLLCHFAANQSEMPFHEALTRQTGAFTIKPNQG